SPEISPVLLREIETLLLAADLGAATVAEVLAQVRRSAEADRQTSGEAVRDAIKDELVRVLNAAPLRTREVPDGQPFVLLVVGVNGVGKTTTIGKLAQFFRGQGHTVLLCAADTFRAAAIEQLEVWGHRVGSEVIRQKSGADPSAVLFDGLSAAKARHCNYVIIDTAGRLHTKSNLMDELSKMRRTAERLVPGAPHETLLVLDATTGQNGLQQARQFTAAAGVTGLVVTKLDGTARGGIVVAIARELGLPVRFVGVGEGADDLIPFEAERYIDALFAKG
ncbi:MAG: signal recognition particle-docking protein FtsY, partial [Terriglobales bacterium]